MTTTAVGDESRPRGSEQKDSLRVVIADDSVLLREGIARLLEESGFEVVGQAGDGEDLLPQGRRAQAGRGGGRRAHAADAQRRGPARRPPHPRRVSGHRRARPLPIRGGGVRARAAVRVPPRAPATCSRTASPTSRASPTPCGGWQTAARRSTLRSWGLLLGRRRREDPLAALSPREREVLGLMAEGRSNSAMADALGVSERAVEKHVTAMLPSSTCRARQPITGECWPS